MNDTARLAWHRAVESDGSTTPAQSRSLANTDHPRPWTAHTSYGLGWSVRDADGVTVAQHLTARDAKIIAAAPDAAELAQKLCDEFDRVLTRVGL